MNAIDGICQQLLETTGIGSEKLSMASSVLSVLKMAKYNVRCICFSVQKQAFDQMFILTVCDCPGRMEIVHGERLCPEQRIDPVLVRKEPKKPNIMAVVCHAFA
jgi:hypothetical protein